MQLYFIHVTTEQLGTTYKFNDNIPSIYFIL